MSEQQNQDSPKHDAGHETKRFPLRRAIGYTVSLVLLGGFSLVAGFETARHTFSNSNPNSAPSPQSLAPPATPVRMPTPENDGESEIKHLPAQQQAERLLERAIHNDEASLNLLREKVDSWRGHLKNTDQLFDLVLAALNSADLRLRMAGVDVDLAANNLSKSPESVTQLIRQLQRGPAGRGMALWRLGALGNRGVEPKRVLNTLLSFSHNPNEHTRYWAVEGLAMLGNDATIDPLLNLLTHDPSPRVRERAASSLGQSGLLTREERLAAVPQLLNFADDDSLNTTTRELVYGTLRVITGAPLGNDAGAWREWWASHDPARNRPRQRTRLLQA
ncbi:MAG TPA: HEAT repeat domain-containing protein [Candidatus Acidoferrum sp.]|nr:HEAT repeat domain-containing protein [Candidatus Acidoferrum sp.]